MQLNKENMKKILLIVAAAILLYTGLQHIRSIMGVVEWVLALVYPFLLGSCVAFIINVPMQAIERGLFGHYKGKRQKLIRKIKRPVSFLVTLLLVLGVLFIVVFLVVPQLGDTITSIYNSLPGFFENIQNFINNLIVKYEELTDKIVELNINWDKISESIMTFLKDGVGSIFSSTMGIAVSIVNGVVTFFLGFIFAIYILFQKESLGSQFKKVMYAYLPEARVSRILEISYLANRVFSRFLSGQCLEAVILGTMFFIVLTLFRMPYALLIGVIIAFSALIPIVGAFIGCILGALLILMVSPIKAFWFIVIFLCLQQLEGNLIYPRVVGGSIGLPSIWVLVAVTVGGSVWGIAGMLIFIPLTSVLYALFRDAVKKRLANRRIDMEKVKRKDTLKKN